MRTGGQSLPFSTFSYRPVVLLSLPSRPAIGCRTSTFPFTRTGGQSLPFSTFSPRARVVLLPLPCRPPSDAACARRGDASRWARPRRPSAGFSNGGAARSAAVPFCPSLPRRPAVLLSLPSRPANDAARHFSCILLSRRAAGTAPRSLPPARVAEQRAPFSPYRRRARHCTSFSAPRRPPPDAAHGRPIHPDRQDNPSSLSHASGRRARPCEPAGSPFPFPHFPTARPYFFLYPAVLPTMPRAHAAAMLPDGLVRGGFLRAFAGPPRRCLPMGSSEAAFCGVLKRRRCAQRRRSLLSFSPPPPGRTSFFTSRPPSDAACHFSCILLSRRAAGTAPRSLPPARVAEQHAPFSPYRRRARHCTSFSTPRRPGNGCRASVPAHANRRAVPSISTLFRIFPRARVMLLPLPCRPANDTAHGRHGDASRWSRLRRPSTGFCRVAEAMLPDGLV